MHRVGPNNNGVLQYPSFLSLQKNVVDEKGPFSACPSVSEVQFVSEVQTLNIWYLRSANPKSNDMIFFSGITVLVSNK